MHTKKALLRAFFVSMFYRYIKNKPCTGLVLCIQHDINHYFAKSFDTKGKLRPLDAAKIKL